MGLFDRFTKKNLNSSNEASLVETGDKQALVDPDSIEKAISQRAQVYSYELFYLVVLNV